MLVLHFKMETQGSVRSAITSQEWTISIVIRDAYLHAPGRPQVSTLRGQQASVPVHLSPLWVSDFSMRVYQAAVSHRSAVKVARCEATHLLRQLADQSRYSGTGKTARPDDQQCAPVSRLDHQLREVRPRSKSGLSSSLGCSSTLDNSQRGLPTEVASQVPVRSSALDYRPEHHSQGSAQASRHVGVNSFAGTTEKTPSSSSSSGGPPQHGARGPVAGPTGSQFLSGFCQRWPGGHLQQSCKVYPSPPRRWKWLSSRMRPVRDGEPS